MLKLINSTQHLINPKLFGGGPWVHLATVTRSRPDSIERAYVCFRHARSEHVYIEEADPDHPGVFKRIEDDHEFEDVEAFLRAAGVLGFKPGQEIKLGKV